MFGLEIIEVGIGLAFAYFAISVIGSGIVEIGVKLTSLRAKHLKEALGNLLDDKNYNGFVAQLYEHHLITSPMKDKLGDPKSMKAKDFAAAVFDILCDGSTEDERYQKIKARIETIKDEKVKTRLLNILESSAEDLESMRDKVESWFNESMEAVSEWYRQRMRFWVTIVSFAVVGAMNADTIRMTKMLWNDNELRQSTVAAAESFANSMETRFQEQSADTAAKSFGQALEQIKSDIDRTKVLPIGWNSEVTPLQAEFQGDATRWWLLKVLGLLLTIGAVSMGSTYWYRQLKQLLNLRVGKQNSAGGGGGTTTVNVNTNNNGGTNTPTNNNTSPPQ